MYIITTRFRHVSLHKLTQDLSWLFAEMLQHDQRYLLAEAVYFLLAFFLTLSDHRRGIAKASKVPCDARCITFLANTFERRKKKIDSNHS